MDIEIEEKFRKLENKIANHENEIQSLKKIMENSLQSKSSVNNNLLPSSTISEEKLVKKIDDISPQHLIVIALRTYKKLTKTEIQQRLRIWGKDFGNWFQGGNLNNRLINKSIIIVIRKNSDNDDVYSLSKKGESMADEYINKYELK